MLCIFSFFIFMLIALSEPKGETQVLLWFLSFKMSKNEIQHSARQRAQEQLT
jgi:hypothetical protein